MLQDYAPILLLLGMVAVFAVANLLLSELVGRKRKVIGKGGAYECGMEPVGTARLRLSIHFYLTAVLFILFDVEGIFLMLWSTAAKSFQAAGAGGLVFTEILIFVAMLVVALVFVWRKGGLEWDR
ncbi:MAG: NADH-quinone oxidoreductase subunit A [Planctomycetota bacterium]|nr:NADH-quinone oxidoreductase subunit A [Planctomycetota bacterium]